MYHTSLCVLLFLFFTLITTTATISATPDFDSKISASAWDRAFPSSKSTPLSRGRTASSVVLVNSTFVVLGGCTGKNNEDCLQNEDLATQIEAFDALSGEQVDPVARIGLASNQLPSAPRGWSGKQAAVTLDQQIYIMHMCTVYPKSDVPNPLPPEELAFYKQTVVLSTGITAPPVPASNVTDFPFALANASCSVNENSIIVIGGYDLENRKLSNRIYTYDTVQQTPWQVVVLDDGSNNPPPIDIPVMHPAVAADSGSLFVVSGVHADGTVSQNVYRFILLVDLPTQMCKIDLAQLDGSFAPSFSPQAGLDHSLVVFGGDLMYFFSGSKKMAVLKGASQTNTWEVDAATLPAAPKRDTYRAGFINCTIEDDEEEGMIYAATIMTNTTGSTLYFYRIGGASTESCLEYYTTSSTTTTVTTTSTTHTSTTAATLPTTSSTTEPPATSSATSTSTASPPELENYRPVIFETTSADVFISKSSLTRAAPLLPDNRIVSTRFKINVNTSIDRSTIDACNVSNQPCLWRVSPSFSCIGDEDSSNRWTFGPGNPDGTTTLLVAENQFPLYICFQGANYPGLHQCSSQARNARTSYDVLNRLEAISTVGDAPLTPGPNTTSPGPEDAPVAPILSQGAIIAIVVSGVCFLLVVALAWSKRLRSEDLSSAAAIIRDSRYEFLEPLGEGGFGQVVRVRRRADDEIFALKYMEIPTSKEMHDALHEFEIMRQLQNFPNIITIHDLFLNFELDANLRKSGTRRSSMMGSKNGRSGSNLDEGREPLLLHPGGNRRTGSRLDGGSDVGSGSFAGGEQKPKRVLCFVMDYHPDGDLKTMILDRYGTGEDEERNPPEPLLAHIALQLLRTLDFIHERGIVHRDIKPENILVARSNQKFGDGAPAEMFQKVVVTDFGLAKIMEINTDGILFGGTMAFASPEQLKYLQYFMNLKGGQQQQHQQQLLLDDGAARRRSNSQTNLSFPTRRNSNPASKFSPKEVEEQQQQQKHQDHAIVDVPSQASEVADKNQQSSNDSSNNDQAKRFSINGSRSHTEDVSYGTVADDTNNKTATNNNTEKLSDNKQKNSDNNSGSSTERSMSTHARSTPATASPTFAPQPPSEMPSSQSTKPPVPDAAADVWSLGCVLYSCMTKKLTPSRGVRVLANDLFEKYEGNEERFSDSLTRELTGLHYSAAFVSLIVAMLKGNPEERVTPSAALQYFRKSVKDHTYYVSSRPAQQK